MVHLQHSRKGSCLEVQQLLHYHLYHQPPLVISDLASSDLSTRSSSPWNAPHRNAPQLFNCGNVRAPCNGLDDGALHLNASLGCITDWLSEGRCISVKWGYNLGPCIALMHTCCHRCVIAFHKGPRLYALHSSLRAFVVIFAILDFSPRWWFDSLQCVTILNPCCAQCRGQFVCFCVK